MAGKRRQFPVGLRTLKTGMAVILAMAAVEVVGASSSPMIYAMLGAMAAMEPTFKDSVEACIVQTVSIILGGIAGVLLIMLKLEPVIAAGTGVVMMIIFFNACMIRFSPALACLIVVTLCTSDTGHPVVYAAGRIWDTAVGLAIGLALNTMVFPYDNSQQIRKLIESLDREVISFLEDAFDGDDVLPDVEKMTGKIDDMARQLRTFGNQRLIHRLHRQKEELEQFRRCEGMARELLARMEVLSRMGRPGRLNDENRQRLKASGAEIRDRRPLKNPQERDMVTNYHVRQILTLRTELLDVMASKQ